MASPARSPGKPSDSPCTSRRLSLFISNLSLALTALAQAAIKKEALMHCASSKLQTRARILEAGLNAAQARNWPSADSTRTVSPASAAPLAMADSKSHGWRRKSERSLPAFNWIVFMARIVGPNEAGLFRSLGAAPGCAKARHQ